MMRNALRKLPPIDICAGLLVAVSLSGFYTGFMPLAVPTICLAWPAWILAWYCLFAYRTWAAAAAVAMGFLAVTAFADTVLFPLYLWWVTA